MGFIILVIFANSLLSLMAAFVTYYVFGKRALGGFWLLALVSLIGAFMGTFIGIVAQAGPLPVSQPVLAIVFPLAGVILIQGAWIKIASLHGAD